MKMNTQLVRMTCVNILIFIKYTFFSKHNYIMISITTKDVLNIFNKYPIFAKC